MKASQVIRSIKTNVQSWSVVYESDTAIVFTNSKGWTFTNYVGTGFVLKCRSQSVEMTWDKSDMVADQLWMSLLDVLLGI